MKAPLMVSVSEAQTWTDCRSLNGQNKIRHLTYMNLNMEAGTQRYIAAVVCCNVPMRKLWCNFSILLWSLIKGELLLITCYSNKCSLSETSKLERINLCNYQSELQWDVKPHLLKEFSCIGPLRNCSVVALISWVWIRLVVCRLLSHSQEQNQRIVTALVETRGQIHRIHCGWITERGCVWEGKILSQLLWTFSGVSPASVSGWIHVRSQQDIVRGEFPESF